MGAIVLAILALAISVIVCAILGGQGHRPFGDCDRQNIC
jgi:hypothetical protein